MRIMFLFQMVALALTVLAAFRWGGSPEKIGAVILAAMAIIDPIYHFFFGWGTYAHIDLWHLTLDSAALLAMLWLALSADRFWPLCLAAFQLISAVAHLLRVLSADMPELVYAIMMRWPSYFLILILAIATANHRRCKIAMSTKTQQHS